MEFCNEQSLREAINALNEASPFANELYGNIFRRPEDFKELKSYVCRLCSDSTHHAVKNYINDYIHKMQELQLSSIKKTAKKESSISVAFFCPTKAFRNQFGDLPKRLIEKGYTVLYLYGETHNDSFESHATSYLVGGELIAELNFIDCFCVASIMDCLPRVSKKILFDHLSFAAFLPYTNDLQDKTPRYEDLVNYYTHTTAFFRLFDVFIVPSKPFKVDAIQRGRFFGLNELEKTNKINNKKHKYANMFLNNLNPESVRDKHIIVEGGYPKLDYFFNANSKKDNTEDIIVYAPTHNNQAHIDTWLPYISVNEEGANILRSLAEEFPDYKIIFKPHIDESKSLIDWIMNHVADFKNISIDLSGSNYELLYEKTRIIVSDFSSTAYTFAAATGRPVIFYSRNEKLVSLLESKKGLRDTYCKHREDVGVVVSSIDDLGLTARKLIDNMSNYRAKIDRFRQRYFYNIGNSSEYIADNFEKILQKKHIDSWVLFESKNNSLFEKVKSFLNLKV